MKTRKKTDETDELIDPEEVAGGSELAGYLLLVEHLKSSAEHDLTHVHGGSRCMSKGRELTQARGTIGRMTRERLCDVREEAARFLKDIRSGRAGLWSQWIDYATTRSGGPSRMLTDDVDDEIGDSRKESPICIAAHPPAPVVDATPKPAGRIGHSKKVKEQYAAEHGLLTSEQAMRLVGFTPNSWYRNVAKGRIPIAATIGPAKLFRRSDIEIFMVTPQYSKGVKFRDAVLQSKHQVTAEAVVSAGFSLDAAGRAEYLRLKRDCEREKRPALATV